MKFRHRLLAACIGVSTFCSLLNAQQPSTSAALAVVPRLVNFSGKATDGQGKAMSGVAGATFAIYKDQYQGSPLWLETQNIQPDAKGNYTIQLGATKPEGLPLDLFTSGEARWLGVTISDGSEQPRILLLSVPYALKAADAETVGGLPASAFVLAAPAMGGEAASSHAAETASSSATSQASSTVTTTGGTINALPLFTTANNIQDSLLTQTGTTAINVAGKLNLPATGTATATAGMNSQPETYVASVFNQTTATAVSQKFQLQAEPAGNNTATASGTLNLLYATGTNAPAETGLKIGSDGLITFAKGQTYPGVSIASGPGLTGGPITGTGTLSIANAGVTNAMLEHPSLTVTPGTGLTGGGTIALGGAAKLNLDTKKIPLLASANIFTKNQTINGVANAYSLTVSNPDYLAILTQGPESGIGTALEMQTTGTGGMSWQILNTGAGASQGTNKLNFRNDSAGGGDVMTLLSTGIVGIGTPNPTGHAQLEIDSQNQVPNSLAANGYTAPNGSGLPGGAGVVGIGGNGDLGTETFGGYGIVGYGGVGGFNANGGFDGVGGAFVGGNHANFGDGVNATAGSGNAGSFNGNVYVSGNLSKAGGSFKIDHPLDPANKYLYHSFVESPDMKNIYDGVATLDAGGEAVITMPDWFSVLNRDFRYQLTCIGGFAPVYIAEKLANNQFKIGGGKPGMEVSWQITGTRHDAWANAHRIPVEEEKEARLKGFYIHPELYGAPPEKQIEWARHPQAMKQMQEHRLQMATKRNPAKVTASVKP